MPAIYSHSHLVTADEIDGQGHVNNLHYLKWMERAAVAHSTAQGWPPERYREFGAGWVVRSHQIDYHRPTFEGEHVIIRTWVSDFGKATSLRKYQVIRVHDEAVVATGQTQWAFLRFQPYAPCRIPVELSAAFVLVPAADEPI